MLAPLLAAQTATVSGTVSNPDGSAFNGVFTISLASGRVNNICSTAAVTSHLAVSVINGIFPSTQLLPTPCLSPSIPYFVSVTDTTHKPIYTDNWYIPQTLSGAVNVGEMGEVKLASGITVAVPLAIISTPLGNQTITQPAGTYLTVNNLTVTGSLTTSGGLSGALSLTGGTMSGTIGFTNATVAATTAANMITGNPIAPSVISGNTYDFCENGGACNDSTDDTAAFNTLLSVLYSNGGGQIFIPKKVLMTGQITLPNSGASLPTQPPIRIFGPVSPGASADAPVAPFQGGGSLDLRYNAPVAKIITLGLGKLEIDNLNIIDGGSDCAPFLLTTNTTLSINGDTFQGTASGTSACNDALILGGTTTTEVPATSSSPFQGYGTVIQGSGFHQIRRATLGQYYANNVVIQNNHVDRDSGNSVDGAFVFNGDPGDPDMGEVVQGNLIECTNYKYGVYLGAYVNSSFISGNGCWDTTGYTLYASHQDTGDTGNYFNWTVFPVNSALDNLNLSNDLSPDGYGQAYLNYIQGGPGGLVFNIPSGQYMIFRVNGVNQFYLDGTNGINFGGYGAIGTSDSTSLLQAWIQQLYLVPSRTSSYAGGLTVPALTAERNWNFLDTSGTIGLMPSLNPGYAVCELPSHAQGHCTGVVSSTGSCPCS
jgi:hypothetical protein